MRFTRDTRLWRSPEGFYHVRFNGTEAFSFLIVLAVAHANKLCARLIEPSPCNFLTGGYFSSDLRGLAFPARLTPYWLIQLSRGDRTRRNIKLALKKRNEFSTSVYGANAEKRVSGTRIPLTRSAAREVLLRARGRCDVTLATELRGGTIKLPLERAVECRF